LQRKSFYSTLTNWLHGAESFLRSRQSLSYSVTSLHFLEPEGSLQCSQEPARNIYPKPNESRPISLSRTLILSSHLRLGFHSGLFSLFCPNPVCIHLPSTACSMPSPPHPVLLNTTTLFAMVGLCYSTDRRWLHGGTLGWIPEPSRHIRGGRCGTRPHFSPIIFGPSLRIIPPLLYNDLSSPPGDVRLPDKAAHCNIVALKYGAPSLTWHPVRF
jgi:hypothetical protein